MNLKISLTLLGIFLLMSPSVSAHPGKTASDGCHTCKTNCDKWGVPWNERHCHGAAESAPVQPQAKKAIPLLTRKPVLKPTRIPTDKPRPTKKLSPTSAPTRKPTATSRPIKKEVLNEASVVDLVPKKTGFWERLLSLVR